MKLREITMTNFVLLQDTWTNANCLDLLKHLQPSHAIISREKEPDGYYLLEAASLVELLLHTPHTAPLAEALTRTMYRPVPALESDSEAEDVPDQCVVLEGGYPIGFFDAGIPANAEALRQGHKNIDETAESRFALSSLIVDAPKTVPLHGAVSVLIFLSAEAIIEKYPALSLPLPTSTTVDIIMRARQGLVCEEETEGQLIIPDKGETLPLRFRLRGVEAGLGKYTIFAFHNRQPLGVLYLDIQVMPASDASESSHSSTTYFLQPLDTYSPGLPQLTLERKLMGKREITPPLRVHSSSQDQFNSSTTTPSFSHPQIFWQECDAEQLVWDLEPAWQSSKTNSQVNTLLAKELHALLAHLFSETEAILVTPLLPGFSSAKVLKVQPFISGSGGGGLFVVKFGNAHVIEYEYINYQKYVFYHNKSGRYTAAFKQQRMANLGAILYAFAGADLRNTHEFGIVYQQREFPQIQEVLNNIFYSVCGSWYQNTNPLYPLNLTQAYQQQESDSPRELEDIIVKHLPTVQFQQVLTFTSFKMMPSRSFPNPFRVLSTAQPLIRSTYKAITHGDLNQRNILVDHLGYPWLIDFQSTGPGHILRDVATLDAVTRFQLLAASQATLDEFLAIEETLSAVQYFRQLDELPDSPVTDNPALVKVYQTTVHLRKLARWMVRDQDKDMSEYYIALLYITLETLRYFSLSREQRERALLSASLLIDILGLSKG